MAKAPTKRQAAKKSPTAEKSGRGADRSTTTRAYESPRANSKSANLIVLLSNKQGASLEQLQKAGRWQAHSVRGLPRPGPQAGRRASGSRDSENDVSTYLALGSMLALQKELNLHGVTTRPRVLSTGQTIGGVPFTRGPLAHLLKNRTYLGYINHRDQSYQGEHEPIIDQDLFEAVQRQLAENLKGHAAIRAQSNALLLGKLFDDAGNTMTPTYARKGGVRYRYYVSRALTEGRRDKGGSVQRAPADSIETKVAEALQHLENPTDGNDSRAVVQRYVRRVIVGQARLAIELTEEGVAQSGQQALQVAWSPPPPKPRREIIASSRKPGDTRPIRSDTRATLLSAIATGRQWLQDLISGKIADTDAIAQREGRSKRSVHMSISLAFVAPDIVEAAVDGKLPRGIGASRLLDLPPSWPLQRKRLGLSPRPL